MLFVRYRWVTDTDSPFLTHRPTVLHWTAAPTMEALRNMGTDSGTTGDSGTGTGLRHLWLTSEQACAQLGIKPRALRKRVTTGTVERRRVGRKSLYRVAVPAPATEEPGTTPGAPGAPVHHLYRHTGTGTAPQRVPQLDASPDLATLTALVQQLTSDLAQASQDKGEAIGIGWTLAEQREELAAELTRLQRAIFQVADSPLALPVRRRIMQILRQSLH